MDFVERLKKIRKNAGQTQEKFAEKIGLGRGTYNNYEAGQSEPSFATLTLIAQKFQIDLNWLITGVAAAAPAPEVTETQQSITVKHLPNMIAFAGDVISIDDASLSEVEEWSIPRMGIGTARHGAGGTLYSFEVKGNSMEPTFRERDVLLCEPPCMSIKDIEPGAAYVIVYNGVVRCKRLYPASDNLSVTLRSDNTVYQPESIGEGMFSALRVKLRLTDVSNWV
jgi:transcriptional regulator with XRE-family HTH domain